MNSNLPNNRGRGRRGWEGGEVVEGGELRLEGCSPHQQPPAEGAHEEVAVGRPTPKLSLMDHSLLYKYITE